MLNTVLGRVGQRDPTSFIGAFSMWAIMCGVQLLWPGDVASTLPHFRLMHELYHDDRAWGIIMLIDGLLLQFSLFLPKRHGGACRSAIAGASACLWMGLGMLMVLSAWRAGYFTVVGAFSVWGGVGCFMAITQWIYIED